MKRGFIIFGALLICIFFVTEVFSQDNNTYSCAKDKRRYWLRDSDKDCKLTCGDFFDSFMAEKGYELADYNCISNEPLDKGEIKIMDNVSGISDLNDIKFGEDNQLDTEDELEEMEKESNSVWYISIIGFIAVIILVWWISSRKKRRKNF